MIDTVIILENGKVMFNQEMTNISEKLVFKTIEGDTEADEEILYSEESIMNKKAILKNANKEDSLIDIELLFNAIISEDEQLTQHFNTK